MNAIAGGTMDWRDDLELGVASLDEQHAELMAHAERITRSIAGAADAALLARQLVQLVRATERHFADEERLMADSGYPECAIHLEQHRELLGQLRRFAEGDAFARGTHEALKATRFLSDWLARHISVADRRFAAHLMRPDNRSTQYRDADSRIR